MKLSFLVGLLLVLILFQKEILSQEKIKHPDFGEVYTYSLRGDIKRALQVLDTLNTDLMDSTQLALKAKYQSRFIEKNSAESLWTDSEEINEMLSIFRNYWQEVMVGSINLEKADSLLKDKMVAYLAENFEQIQSYSRDSIRENIYDITNDFIHSRGFEGNAMGKTPPYFDIYLWKKNEEKEYEIHLFDDTVTVKVVFMQNFISRGWLGYATFDKYYAGGWATKEALYVVEDSYDLESEDFFINYLTHEGQHFSDFKRFPRLKSPDLEYRAKLIQLIYMDETFDKVIDYFIHQYDDNPNNPHGLANLMLIRDLSRILFSAEREEDFEKWQSLSREKIREASKQLFQEHTQKLIEMGADDVEALISLEGY